MSAMNPSAIGDKYAAQISDAFLAWRDAYEAGEATGTVHIEPFDPSELIRACYEEAGVAGAEAITELVEGPRTGFAFNLRSPEAEKWISDYAAQEIRYVDAATKQTIRQITLRAFQEGLTAQQQSKLIRLHIGLLPQHAVAVRNYRDSLEGIDLAVRDKLVDKYRRKLLKWRADTIALTESHTASNEGNRESVRQAVKRNILDPDEYEMELFNHHDKRICPICDGLRGQRCPLPGGIYGGRSGPPFHPRCRDTEVTVRVGSKSRSSKAVESSESGYSPRGPSTKSSASPTKPVEQTIKGNKPLPGEPIPKAVRPQPEALKQVIRKPAKLTEDEKYSVEHYASDGFLDTNKYLRGQSGYRAREDDIKKNVARLDSAIDKSTVPKCTVYRGFESSKIYDNLGNLKGAVIDDKAFVSTSLKKDIGNFYATGPKNMILEISIPDGSKALELKGLATNKAESEVLLPRNSKFRVIESLKMPNGQGYIKAELVQ